MSRFTLNERIHNFVVEEIHTIKELDGIGYLMKHEKSGARLFYLDNKDEDKTFCVSFCTPPKNDTGVFHILEHSVLSGSKKYPVSEPFVELMKSSLSTFLNAMTFSDKTMFPVSSRNEKDLENLMAVYLDGVFAPNIYTNPDIMRQEGWHYEFDEDNVPYYQGVVYNEMKDSLSDPEQLLMENIKKSLFEECCYTYNSGGDPNVIVQLTQEEFIKTHETYYHPSNAYFFLYGDMEIQSKLQFLDEEYLSGYSASKIEHDLTVSLKSDMNEVFTCTYPVLEEEGMQGRDWISFNFSIGETDHETDIAFSILLDVLAGSNYAPLKQAILENGIAQEVEFMQPDGIHHLYLSLWLMECDASQLDEINQVIWEELRDLAESGIDKELLRASLASLQFSLKEKPYAQADHGVSYAMESMKGWLYGGTPWEYLEYQEALNHIREKIDSDYFENLIDTYLLQNTHRSTVIMKPSVMEADLYDAPVIDESQMKEEKKISYAYQERQKESDSEENLRTIPALKLSDIKPLASDFSSQLIIIDEKELLYHPLETHGIVYYNLYFDITSTDQDTLQDLGLLAMLYSWVGTEQLEPEDLDLQIKLHTGGIQFIPQVYSLQEGVSVKFMIAVKALSEEWEKARELTEEILLHSKWNDKELMRFILSQKYFGMKMELMSSGFGYGDVKAASAISQKCACMEEIQGIAFYDRLKSIVEDFDNQFASLSQRLSAFVEKHLQNNTCYASTTCNEELKSQICNKSLICNDKMENITTTISHKQLPAGNEAFLTTAGVQFVTMAVDFSNQDDLEYGVLCAFKKVISLKYLWKKVRVQGGAYGCGMDISRDDKLLMWSYRDPHIKSTIDTFESLGEYVKNLELSEAELERMVIGTFSEIDSPLSPQQFASRSDSYYFLGISQEQLQQEREQLFQVTVEDLRKCSVIMDKTSGDSNICVIGNAEKVQENQELFTRIRLI